MTKDIYRHTERSEVSVFSLVLTDSSGAALRMTEKVRHIERSEISFFDFFVSQALKQADFHSAEKNNPVNCNSHSLAIASQYRFFGINPSE